jgi:hypothetical protein
MNERDSVSEPPRDNAAVLVGDLAPSCAQKVN